jgi:hypothetical protein
MLGHLSTLPFIISYMVKVQTHLPSCRLSFSLYLSLAPLPASNHEARWEPKETASSVLSPVPSRGCGDQHVPDCKSRNLCTVWLQCYRGAWKGKCHEMFAVKMRQRVAIWQRVVLAENLIFLSPVQNNFAERQSDCRQSIFNTSRKLCLPVFFYCESYWLENDLGWLTILLRIL